MTPVLCVGERVEGEDRNDIVDTQLASAISGLSQQERSACIVAYEPVWAISTSDSARPDTPANASSVAEHIRQIWGPRAVLYGGSVNGQTVGGFWSASSIDGVLVGKASTTVESLNELKAGIL
jgi:triosephosphate isomerase